MKIGIITIHRIDNYGSALQAYALQKFLQRNTQHEIEIINYVFPNEYHLSRRRKVSKFELLWCYANNLWALIVHGSDIRKRRFRIFREKCFNLSSKTFRSITEIESHPPLYDLYITGSDQVWNPNSLFNDPTFYCHFAPQDTKRFSFAASFSNDNIPVEYRKSIKDHLTLYSAIGVREQQGAKLISGLGVDSTIPISLNCDPTMLLSADDYAELAELSEVTIPKQYILVYYLDYAFNPHPAIDNVLKYAQKKFELPVVFIGVQYRWRPLGSKYFFNSGPAEFCHLFKNATYVITSSFHGVMFSIINRAPFTVVVPNQDDHDTRIADVLGVLGLNDRSVMRDSKETSFNTDNPYTAKVESNIDGFIQTSKDFLLNNIQ